MNHPPSHARKEQQLLRHARREGLVIMVVWAIALVWSVLGSYLTGYQRKAEDIGLILGIPDWVFWNIFVPWGLGVVFSVWFCFFYMADDDLGKDPEEPNNG